MVAESTGQPLLGATVSVSPTGDGAITDAQGQFRVDIPPGKYTVEVSFTGHAPSTREVEVGAQPLQVSFTLRDDPRYAETIVIVGSRTPRSATSSPVPVDVITSEQIQEVGEIETNQVLRTVAPSYNASHQAIADGTDHIDPASLRGLGPDQVLVLVNGKRRHHAALINVNGSFGRGTVGTDMNAIPTSSIERIEVLRDGAAAQYGSDAIAGVINVVLKEQPGVVEATAISGLTGSGDGFQLKTGVNYGVPVGELGVVNLTAEFIQRSPTDRGGEYSGDTFYPGVTDRAETDRLLAEAGLSREDVSMDIGQSEATVGSFFMNARFPLGAAEVYSNAGLTYRQGAAPGFYRRPNQGTQTPLDLYPNGFLPEIHPTIIDWSATAGVRSEREKAGFTWDLSASHGGSSLHYDIQNSANASLGPASPTEFDAGGFAATQTTVNADVVQPFETSLKKLALVGGAEYRLETFQINAGEEDSWRDGGMSPNPDMEGAPLGVPGSQVFPGFQPANEVEESRNSGAGYVGLETEIGERLMVDVAGRFEQYDDFGSTLNGKIAARVAIVDQLALRGAVSTGFRAPSLQQFYFNNTSTQFITVGEDTSPGQVLTIRNDSRVASLFGVPNLEEETSRNGSVGFVFTPAENFSLTADAYVIDIDNRIVLSGQFFEDQQGNGVPGTADLLLGLNPRVDRVQFFTNAIDTRTWGTDVVADYWSDLGAGRLGITAAGNFTRTRVRDFELPPTVVASFPEASPAQLRAAVFSREEENRLEDALPREKGLLQGKYSIGPFAGLLRANYWGEVKYKALDPMNDEEFGAKVTLDADIGYELMSGFKVGIGGTNLLNTFPDEQVKPANIVDGQFKYSRRVSQFGTNGGFYYLRLQYLY